MFVAYKVGGKKIRYIMMLCTVLLISHIYTIYTFSKFDNSLANFNEKCICVGKILNFEKETEYSYKYVFKIDKVILEDKTQINLECKNIKVYIYLNDKYSYGDTLTCNLEFEQPISNTNIGGFNNKLFMYSNGISGYAYLQKLISIHEKNDGLIYYIEKVKYELCNIIDKSFEPDIANIIRTMLLNDDTTISKETKDIFYNIGISHILVPSSTHLMYILVLVTYIISTLGIKLKYKNLISFFVILIYLVITNFAVSILRVFLMYFLTLFLNICKFENTKKLDIMCVALMCILIANPIMIYNVGLLLSFGSVLGIMLFTNKIKNKLQYGINRNNDNRFISRIIELISVTLAVQIVIIPILTNCFNTVYILSIFANIFVVPLAGLTIIISIFFCIAYNIPLISDILACLNTLIVSIIIQISNFFNILPLSKICAFPLKIHEIFIYYALIYILFFSKEYLYSVKICVAEIFRKKAKLIVCVMSLMISIFFISFLYNYISLKVQFIDVGQGDCTFIQTYGKNILIDGGGGNNSEFDIGERILMPYLLYNRVINIDYMFISHFDSDHFQGLCAVIDNIRVKNLVISKQYIMSTEFISFMEKVKSKKIKVIVIEGGDVIYINKNVFFNIIYPDNVFIPNNINNNSVVMKFIYYNFSILFTGDVEEQVEEYLVEEFPYILKSNLLKVGHHGSKTSTTQEFLDCVIPDNALIGVGRKNSFGHPSNEVISLLKDKGISIYRTDINGQVSVFKYMNNRIKIWSMF